MKSPHSSQSPLSLALLLVAGVVFFLIGLAVGGGAIGLAVVGALLTTTFSWKMTGRLIKV